jgi:hypothetical protein
MLPRGAHATQRLSGEDSASIVRRARAAQRDCEAFRRAHLPTGDDGGGLCDMRIGRYCYWRGGDSDDEPPAEFPPIVVQRTKLLATLDSATTRLPGDVWLAGQYAGYLVEAGRTDDALRFASRCRAGIAWCAELAGYAAHRAGQFARADSAYRAALDAVPAEARCALLDIGELLDGALADRWSRLDCPARDTLARRILRLGAPLYAISATDLLTEYLARVTRARIAERAVTPDGSVWANDERSLMVRYGWPRWYTRALPPFGSPRPPSIVGHDAGMPYDFLPSLRTVEHIGQCTDDDWQLDDPHAATGYAPAYARSMHDLPSQIARFRRGDSTLVVAAWDARRDTTLLGRDLDAALVLATADGVRAIARDSTQRTRGHLAVTGIIDSGLVSLELLATKDRRAARRRIGVPPRDTSRIALSDLLLYRPRPPIGGSEGGNLEQRLADVEADALSGADVDGYTEAGRVIGVYWELYGLAARGEPLRVTLAVEQGPAGRLRRLAERLHLSDAARTLRVQWEEVAQPVDGIAGRGVRLDLSRLRAGVYHMQLTVTPRAGRAVTAVRTIAVR